jgi:heme O synthase-like polyprenyltransferase
MAAMLIPLFVYINYTVSLYLLALASVWMLWVSMKFYRGSGHSGAERNAVRNTFIAINFYTLILITILSIDKLIKVF